MLTFSSSPLGLLAAFLCTYAIHSTVLLGASWWLTRRLKGRHAAAEEWIWRGALVGGLLTAAIQLSLPARSWLLAQGPTESVAIAKPVEKKSAPSRTPWLEIGREAEVVALESNAKPQAEKVAPVPAPRFAARWLVLPWAVVAAALLTLLALRWWSFRRALSGRRSVLEGHLLSWLDALSDRAGLVRRVRLTASERFAVPFARGLAQPEICMPERALTALARHHQEGILAHEVAHLLRRDPLWLLALRLFEALFFFQPLNRLASRRLTELAELRCDDWAARATGKGRDLAICLTEVAAWMVRGESRGLAPAMAASRSGLAQRIERLMAGAQGAAENPSIPRWLPWVGLTALASVLLLAPGATLAGSETPAPVPQVRADERPVAVGTPAPIPTPRVRKLTRAEEPVAPEAITGGIRGGVRGGVLQGVLDEALESALEEALAPLAELAELESLAELRHFDAVPALAGVSALGALAPVEEWAEWAELAELDSAAAMAPPTPPSPPGTPAPARAPRAYLAPPGFPAATPPPAPPSPPSPPTPPPPGSPRSVDRQVWEEMRRNHAEHDAHRAVIQREVAAAQREALAEARALIEQHREQVEQVRQRAHEVVARHRDQIEGELRQRLEEEVQRGVDREVVERALDQVRASIDRALSHVQRDTERALAEASREVERATRELERARRDRSGRPAARAPRSPTPEARAEEDEETPEPPR